MPKLKVGDDELNVKELEDAEYDDTEFETYDGPQPPKGTILAGYFKSLWWTYTAKEDPMLVWLWIADGNVGDREKFNGLAVWERTALTAGAKFKWGPLFGVLGLTIREVKNKTIVEEEPGRYGDVITKIGTWEPGEDSEDAYCRIVTGREWYKPDGADEGSWQTRIGKVLKWAEPEDDEPEDDDEEPDEPPARTRGRSRKAAAAEPEDEDEDDEDEPEPPARGRRRVAPARMAKAPAKASARGRRGRAAKGDDPPF